MAPDDDEEPQGEVSIPDMDAAARWQWHPDVSPDVHLACSFCGAMFHQRCPAATCRDCGSTATVMAVDDKDKMRVRRCLRCDAVAVW